MLKWGAAEVRAAWKAEGACAVRAGREQGTTRAAKMEADVVAAARARAAAGQEKERAPETRTARRLRGMWRGEWIGRDGRGEGRNEEGRDGRRTGRRGGKCGHGRAGGGVENVRQGMDEGEELKFVCLWCHSRFCVLALWRFHVM